MEIYLDRQLLLRPQAFSEKEAKEERRQRNLGNMDKFDDWTICVWNLNSASRLDSNKICNPAAYRTGIVTAMDAEYVDGMYFDRDMIGQFVRETFEEGYLHPSNVIRVSSPVAHLPIRREKIEEVRMRLEDREMGVMYWPNCGGFNPAGKKNKLGHFSLRNECVPGKLIRQIRKIKPIEI